MTHDPPDTSWTSISEFLRFSLAHCRELPSQEATGLIRYYNSYEKSFGQYLQHHYSNQTSEVTAEIGRRSIPKVLEVGAGCGTESLWFALHGARVTAIDLARDRLDVARARQVHLENLLSKNLSVQFQQASVLEFEPEEAFDIVWMEQTLHHIEPRSAVYGKLFSLLKPGGRLMISEANAWNVALQLQLLARRGWKTKGYFTDEFGVVREYGNERITTALALGHALKRNGFRVEGIRHFRMLPNLNVPRAWIPIERCVLSVMPFLSTHFNIIAQRPPGK